MTDWKEIQITTPRLLLRPWREEDAEALYRFARDPEVGPAAGWPPHTSVENSREIIRGVLSARETYAIVLRYDMKTSDRKETIPAGTPVGSIGILFKGRGSYPHIRDNEAEIGYWLCRPLWGRELAPEALRAIMARCFEELGLERLWCGFYSGNQNSRRVQQKCGFLAETFLCIPPHPLNGATQEFFSACSRYRWLDMNAKPPATTEMSLREAPFRAVESGRKTVEMRLYDEKRRLLRVEDIIRFTLVDGEETLYTTVVGLRYFPSFRDLYEAFLPTHGKAALGYGEDEIPDPADMLAYYTQDTIDYHGVVGIEIALPESRSF